MEAAKYNTELQLRMTLTGDRGSAIVHEQWTSPRHKDRAEEAQASGVADIADKTEARSKRFFKTAMYKYLELR